MNEDDTFNKLRREPFFQLWRKILKTADTHTDDNLIEMIKEDYLSIIGFVTNDAQWARKKRNDNAYMGSGWTREDFVKEIRRIQNEQPR